MNHPAIFKGILSNVENTETIVVKKVVIEAYLSMSTFAFDVNC